ncbi:hypothetical protein WICPIJ_003330 [Wickerhamomyces pijperi]|uniref:Uncharacterized protein n=1 Tax=Wickerhamomyces pijperi TaxID=599730 RepID=A0A9P8QA52_WICPI|nr:hypothetical protein WICPIJ_003330 [Wickerhamomyces pijperi]
MFKDSMKEQSGIRFKLLSWTSNIFNLVKFVKSGNVSKLFDSNFSSLTKDKIKGLKEVNLALANVKEAKFEDMMFNCVIGFNWRSKVFRLLKGLAMLEMLLLLELMFIFFKEVNWLIDEGSSWILLKDKSSCNKFFNWFTLSGKVSNSLEDKSKIFKFGGNSGKVISLLQLKVKMDKLRNLQMDSGMELMKFLSRSKDTSSLAYTTLGGKTLVLMLTILKELN